jgi:hypothetical protein
LSPLLRSSFERLRVRKRSDPQRRANRSDGPSSGVLRTTLKGVSLFFESAVNFAVKWTLPPNQSGASLLSPEYVYKLKDDQLKGTDHTQSGQRVLC